MNLFSTIVSPIKDLTQAIVMPFKALFVVGLTGAINAMTYNGQWWFKWVALGMGIAVITSLARAAKTLLVLALVGWVGHKIYQRYGQEARDRFADWAARTQPKAAEVLNVLRSPAPDRSAGGSTGRA